MCCRNRQWKCSVCLIAEEGESHTFKSQSRPSSCSSHRSSQVSGSPQVSQVESCSVTVPNNKTSIVYIQGRSCIRCRMFLWLKTSAPFSPLACLFLPQPIFTSVIMNFFNTFTTIQNNSLLNDLFVIIIILNYYNNNNYKINVEGKSTSLMDQHEFYSKWHV